MSRTVTLIGARGGSGTSTVAAALACQAATETTVTLTSNDPIAMAHLLAVPAPVPGDPAVVKPNLSLAVARDQKGGGVVPELRIFDGGTLAGAGQGGDEDARYVVVRGPCYLALATFVGRQERNFDGVILLTEAGRAMTATNVAEVTSLPVVASIPVHARVARCIDAGVLASRAAHLPELAELRALAGLQVDLHRTTVERGLGPDAMPRAADLPALGWERTQ
jgi:hypothetical protein